MFASRRLSRSPPAAAFRAVARGFASALLFVFDFTAALPVAVRPVRRSARQEPALRRPGGCFVGFHYMNEFSSFRNPEQIAIPQFSPRGPSPASAAAPFRHFARLRRRSDPVALRFADAATLM